MEAQACSRYVRQSPRKIRIVINEVRGKKVSDALNYLHFSPKKGSDVIEKTLRSAVSNLLQKADDANIDPDSLIVSKAFVNGGPHMKRFRPASMGRISRLNKPTSHVTVVVCDE
ncbi:MAG TPA: 50S ribosomal protein L22 [Candidatus Marinimicrobia bacterium]|nr:50S ribosomal protein L22 [Candidatus Neomarinimicrobiota bacterium]